MMALFPAAGEALSFALMSTPAVWALHSRLGKDLLSSTLAFCIAFAAVVLVSANRNRDVSCEAASSAIRNDVSEGGCSEYSAGASSPAKNPNLGNAASCTSDEKSTGRESERIADADVPATVITGEHGNAQGNEKQRKIEREPSTGSGRKRPYRAGGEVLYIAEGVAEAMVGILRDPIRGAQGEGARGLVKGITSGVVGMVARPAKGVARAGQNAYTGLRIGVARARSAGRGGSVAPSRRVCSGLDFPHRFCLCTDR